jgi:hypothetical protein
MFPDRGVGPTLAPYRRLRPRAAAEARCLALTRDCENPSGRRVENALLVVSKGWKDTSDSRRITS